MVSRLLSVGHWLDTDRFVGVRVKPEYTLPPLNEDEAEPEPEPSPSKGKGRSID